MKTTREMAKEENQKKIVRNLQELLVKNYDADKGFKKAIKEVKDQELKSFFKGQAILHHRFANELDRLIHSYNAKPMEEGSPAGRFHRLWMDIIIGIGGEDDKTILNECRRGQKATMREYEEKIKKNKFPPRVADILKKQLLELQSAIETATMPEKTA